MSVWKIGQVVGLTTVNEFHPSKTWRDAVGTISEIDPSFAVIDVCPEHMGRLGGPTVQISAHHNDLEWDMKGMNDKPPRMPPAPVSPTSLRALDVIIGPVLSTTGAVGLPVGHRGVVLAIYTHADPETKFPDWVEASVRVVEDDRRVKLRLQCGVFVRRDDHYTE